MNGTLVILAMVGIPCAVFLLYCLTPGGREWMRRNNLR